MGFAFATLATLALTAAPGRTDVLREERLIGHGTILLSLVLIWIYLAFMQYLVIWSGNMPHHAEWYVRRGEGV